MNGGDIILADEPTGALDSKSGENVMAILKTLNDKGQTIILVTHDKNVANYANRIIEILPEGGTFDRVTTYDEYLEMRG